MTTADLSLDDVRAARAVVEPHVVRTPLARAHRLEDRIGGGVRLWLKCESLQHVGAFKVRGALHAAMGLPPAVRARGLVTYSSGNHAQAVAYAAKLLGVPATVAMPEDAPAIKVAGVRRLGARVLFAGTTSDHRRSAAREEARRTGAAVVEPFDDPRIIAGQGTATLELVEQLRARTGRPPDVLFVPVGGGGLAAGAALAAPRATKIVTVEPSTCDALARSLEAGARVRVEPGPTLADGLKPVRVGARNFEILRHRGVRTHRVDDRRIGRALVALLVEEHLLAEPSAAAALAAALSFPYPAGTRDAVVLLSGGNVEPSVVADLLRRYGDGR